MSAACTDNVLLWNLQQSLLSDWHKEVLQLALEPATKSQGAPPRVFDDADVTRIPGLTWLCFQALLVVSDR